MTRLIILSSLILTLLAGAGITAAQAPATSSVSISYDFKWIRQGSVGIVRVTGPDLTDVRAVFQERVHPFFWDGQRFVGLIAADMEQDVGSYPCRCGCATGMVRRSA